MTYIALLKKVKGITADSREVKKDYLFVAVKGLRSDGHDFISQARDNGAKLVVGERGDVEIKVKDSRKALSVLAAEWYGKPSSKLKIIGVTGTDGKTTTASLIYWFLKGAGKQVGLISTVSAKIGNKEYDTGFHVTNPEPIPLQAFLAKMVREGCEYAVLEVTSHGLDQERVYGINFDVSVLTNVTHEHLDYHKTLENYAKAKAKLFNSSKLAIINEESRSRIDKYITKRVERIFYDSQTLKGLLRRSVSERFKEPYNLLNATAAILVAKYIGVKDAVLAKAVKSFPGVEGRMEEIKNNRGIRIIVDFAHTPNALENVLTVLRKQRPENAKLIAVFGCAGERDIKKRPLMAEISTRLADVSVFTAEDPRSEKVEDIISQMENGIKSKKAKVYKIYDRAEAISFAITKLAKKGDLVVICGKGHEKSMNYNGTEYPWSDHEWVKFAAGKIAVFGLGIEGNDLVSYFQKKGITPAVLDEKPVSGSALKIITGQKALANLKNFDLIFRSPGVYRYRKELVEVEKKGAEISSAIKLFFDLCPAKIIGVTGTKGKGTTSTLIYQILKEAGKDVYLAGNIGKPYLELLPNLNKDSFVVLEMSSFQLIDLTKSPHISVVLNITSDHLNWHKDRQEYVRAKQNIVRYQNEEDFAVINKDYKTSRGFAKVTKAKVIFFSKNNLDRRFKSRVLLRGEHNLENVAAAVSAAKIIGIKDEIIGGVLGSFKGLEHRLELVEKVKGISFYDDSFSTNPEPTIAAARSFGEPLTLILGGYDKGLDYTEMGEEIADNKLVLSIVLIGDTAGKIKKALLASGYKGRIFEMGKPSMDVIVKKSFSVTPEGGVVILSPASASFDMFKDYKERGKKFKEAVKLLPHV